MRRSNRRRPRHGPPLLCGAHADGDRRTICVLPAGHDAAWSPPPPALHVGADGSLFLAAQEAQRCS